MNLRKWFSCWWHQKHLGILLYDKQGRAMTKCVRCGLKL